MDIPAIIAKLITEDPDVINESDEETRRLQRAAEVGGDAERLAYQNALARQGDPDSAKQLKLGARSRNKLTIQGAIQIFSGLVEAAQGPLPSRPKSIADLNLMQRNTSSILDKLYAKQRQYLNACNNYLSACIKIASDLIEKFTSMLLHDFGLHPIDATAIAHDVSDVYFYQTRRQSVSVVNISLASTDNLQNIKNAETQALTQFTAALTKAYERFKYSPYTNVEAPYSFDIGRAGLGIRGRKHRDLSSKLAADPNNMPPVS